MHVHDMYMYIYKAIYNCIMNIIIKFQYKETIAKYFNNNCWIIVDLAIV